jgi:hypothetical protein
MFMIIEIRVRNFRLSPVNRFDHFASVQRQCVLGRQPTIQSNRCFIFQVALLSRWSSIARSSSTGARVSMLIMLLDTSVAPLK